MKKIKMYWSNICILHKFEKEILDGLVQTLAAQDIELEITHFGIGYPMHLSEYLKTEGAEYADIIVSTDLEVFEDETIFSNIKDRLYPICNYFTIKDEIKNSAINRMDTLLPFLAIPLIFCSNQKDLLENLSLKEALNRQIPISFGGVNNSGTKSVIKAVHSAYGENAVKTLMEHAAITNMPVQSFMNIRTGATPLAIVPSVYTKTVDNETLFRQYPADGAIALPSYIAVQNTIEMSDALTVLNQLLTEEFCNYFVTAGDIVCCIEPSVSHELAQENNHKFLYPDHDWFEQMPQEKIAAFYPSL